MSDGKAMIINLIAGLIKNTSYKNGQYFPKPYRSFKGNVKVELDLSSYAPKAELKNATGVYASKLAAKSGLASSKIDKIDKIDIDWLKTVPVDLSKLSNVVNDGIVKKKNVYNKLIDKVNNVDTSGFILKTKYDTHKLDLQKKISDADKKIPDTNGFVKKTCYSAKASEIENKIPSISDLATSSALTAVENKIPDVKNLVKKH